MSGKPAGPAADPAVAAARLGRRVAMVGCVGDDDAGRGLPSPGRPGVAAHPSELDTLPEPSRP
jgi:ribokinase